MTINDINDLKSEVNETNLKSLIAKIAIEVENPSLDSDKASQIIVPKMNESIKLLEDWASKTIADEPTAAITPAKDAILKRKCNMNRIDENTQSKAIEANPSKRHKLG